MAKKIVANQKFLEILHKSKNFIVVNKPYDMIINTDEVDRESVFKLLKSQCPETCNNQIKFGYYICHRLDHATSGVFVIPLNKMATRQASNRFENRQVSKYYLALLRGHCEKDFYKINVPICKDTREEFKNLRMATPNSEFHEKPKNAETLLAVLNRGYFNGDPATKVLLKPLTGRRHQLRVHCHHIGHTIVGDFIYSDRKDCDTERMYLHAYKIVLPTPVEHLDITSQDPFEEIDEYKPKDIIHTLGGGSSVISNFDEIFNQGEEDLK